MAALLAAGACFLQGCGDEPACAEEHIENGVIPAAAKGGDKVDTAGICAAGYEYQGPELSCNWVSQRCKKNHDGEYVDCTHVYDFGESGKALTEWPDGKDPELHAESYGDLAKMKVEEEEEAAAAAAAAAKAKKKRRLADEDAPFYVYAEGLLTAEDLADACVKKEGADDEVIEKFSAGPLTRLQNAGVGAGGMFLVSFSLVVSLGGVGLVVAKMYRPRNLVATGAVPTDEDTIRENTFAEEQGELAE